MYAKQRAALQSTAASNPTAGGCRRGSNIDVCLCTAEGTNIDLDESNVAPAPVPVRPPALLLALEDNSGAQGDGDAGNYRVGRVQCHPVCGMAVAASTTKGSQMCSNCTLGLLTRDTSDAARTIASVWL